MCMRMSTCDLEVIDEALPEPSVDWVRELLVVHHPDGDADPEDDLV